jgi:two-component system sensor histidine kinase AgrC
MIILEIIYFFDFNNITSMVIYLTMMGYSFARLGILIDNSVEAQNERPQLKFFFEERDNTLIFKILNPYPYIKYEEMNTWFDLEHSSKGAKHGLGLYYVKQICQKYRANIICRNVECQGKNWIEMNLEIEKANR